MPISVQFDGKPFHFIGIGGIGMSALAYILTKRNLPVSGSDLRLSHITRRLQEAGAHIFWQQEAANLNYFLSLNSPFENLERPPLNAPSARINQSISSNEALRDKASPQVICSTAIDHRNAEYQAAVDLGYPIFHRSDVLAALISDYEQSIAVAGTHGKTTTSSMIGHLLLHADLDPTIVVGGEVPSWNGNARLGHSPYLVAEADESDGTLAKLSAAIGIVTNIELDHTDHYRNLEDVIEIFQTFQSQCKQLIASLDCDVVRQHLQPDITYSLRADAGATYFATDIQFQADGTIATIWEEGQSIGRLNLGILGHHNLSNALAAVAVGRQLGLPFARIASILASFRGARRRFEQMGHHNNIQFVDDYAHHPSEIRATLSAARLKVDRTTTAKGGFRRVIAVFQPHRFSRTAALLDDFATAFVDADQVIISEIYSAGESNSYGISGKNVAAAVGKFHPQTHYSPTLDQVQADLVNILKPGDIVLFMGAGNLNQIIPQVMAHYADIEAPSLQEAC
jgi:UDP-N-acetylmuramate--alanine ligase